MTIRTVFMGTPDFAVPCVDALHTHPSVELALVVSQPDTTRGRHKTPQPPPVKARALELGVDVAQPRRLKRGAFVERLEALAPDLIVVCAYGRILPKRILELVPHGCLNVHASLLPRWRGAAPLQWCIAAGDQRTGTCLMDMEEGLDTGAVFARWETPIAATETGQSLHDRMSIAGAELLSQHLEAIVAGQLAAIPQDDSQATYARMLTRQDGRLDWSQSAADIDCRIRGFYPWPGAFAQLPDGKTLKLFPPVEVLGQGGEAGEVLESNDRVVIACQTGAVAVREVQLQGKRRMSAGDFNRGYALAPGLKLG